MDRLEFGHKFSDRTGHSPGGSKTEISPIFLQFMDCVHQLILQYPCSFEYTETMLLYILDSLFNCRFGTFLGNSKKERNELKLNEKTKSVWSEVFENAARFKNPLFSSNPQILQFSSSPRVIKFWDNYFLRWDPQFIGTKEDPHSKLNFILQEMEKRQEKLKENKQQLEHKIIHLKKQSLTLPNANSLPQIRGRAILSRTQGFPVNNHVENMVRELISDILDNVFVILNSKSFSVFDFNENQMNPSFSTNSIRRKGIIFQPSNRSFNQNSSQSRIFDETPWIPDHWVNRCHKCLAKFSQIRRKVIFNFFPSALH